MKKITGGLYFLYDNDSLVYIGKSSNIFYRIGTHIHEGIKEFDNWEYQIIEDEEERSNLEGYLIKIFKPKYNQEGEPNTIFDKDKGKNRKYDFKVNIAIETYKTIREYDYIPIKILDEIFGVNNDIGYRLYHYGFIPDSALNNEKVYGYTEHSIINKTWLLQNIDYLVDCVRKMWGEIK